MSYRVTVTLRGENEQAIRRMRRTSPESVSGIVNTALRRYFADTHADDLELILRRLNRQRNEVDRLRQHLSVVEETLLLYVQYSFSQWPPAATENTQEIRARAFGIYQRFIEALRNTIDRGGILIEDLLHSSEVLDEDEDET